jgi:hypothetical protein
MGHKTTGNKTMPNKTSNPFETRPPLDQLMGRVAQAIECSRENVKGCDIGYAPATSSCEEANRVDARTVAALDVITAFAVPNPNYPSQS